MRTLQHVIIFLRSVEFIKILIIYYKVLWIFIFIWLFFSSLLCPSPCASDSPLPLPLLHSTSTLSPSFFFSLLPGLFLLLHPVVSQNLKSVCGPDLESRLYCWSRNLIPECTLCWILLFGLQLFRTKSPSCWKDLFFRSLFIVSAVVHHGVYRKDACLMHVSPQGPESG